MVPGSSASPAEAKSPDLIAEVRACLDSPQAKLLPARVRSLILNLTAVVNTLEVRVSDLESRSKP